MDKLSEEEFLFIWEPILGPDTALLEYYSYNFWCEIDELDFDEED